MFYPTAGSEAQTIRVAKDGKGEGRRTRWKEGNGKLGGWIASEAGREARLALGKWVIRRASASVIACKTLHTLRHCQLPKGSEISNFGNKDEDREQSWETTGKEIRGRTYFVQNRTRRTERRTFVARGGFAKTLEIHNHDEDVEVPANGKRRHS